MRWTQEAGAPEAPQTAAIVLTTSLLVGVVLAAGTGWMLTAAVENYWRRGVTAAVSVLGASLLAVVALPLDAFLGPAGLFVYVAVLVVAAVVATLTAVRNAGT